jgi:hypothetical protein
MKKKKVNQKKHGLLKLKMLEILDGQAPGNLFGMLWL